MITDFPGDHIVSKFYKISGPFKRNTENGPFKNQLKRDEWYAPWFDTLQHAAWNWTLKLDGTNIRIHWDGYRVSVAGRTQAAILPADLVEYINFTFPEELFEEQFGSSPVTLFGEGVGPKIQKGGELHGASKHFRLFGVKQNTWRDRQGVEEVADAFDALVVPLIIGRGSVHDAIRAVEGGLYHDFGQGRFLAEGVVGVPVDGFLDRSGTPISMKIKTVDFWKGPDA